MEMIQLWKELTETYSLRMRECIIGWDSHMMRMMFETASFQIIIISGIIVVIRVLD